MTANKLQLDWIKPMRLLLMVLLAACATGCARSKLPEASSSMAEVYYGVDAASAMHARREINGGSEDLSGWTRDSATELSTRFPRVANPTMVMFVFPHLAGDMPIPGYVTTFPLWESPPYALPGETSTATDEILP
jgi:conjugative transfer region lipoprotein (TIGR03751 family)